MTTYLYDYVVGMLMGIALSSPLLIGAVTASELQQMDNRLAVMEHRAP